MLGLAEKKKRSARHTCGRAHADYQGLTIGVQAECHPVLVYAWTGERDRALEQLEKVATIPGYAPTYGDLRFNPCWDDLRGDPRFDKIVAAAKAASR